MRAAAGAADKKKAATRDGGGLWYSLGVSYRSINPSVMGKNVADEPLV